MAKNEEILRLAMQVTGQAEAEKLKESLSGLGTAAGSSSGEVGKMIGELDELVAAARKLEAFKSGTANLADLESKLATARDKLAGLSREFEGTEKPSRESAKALREAEKEVSGLEKAVAKQSGSLEKLGGELSKSGVDTKELSSETERLKKAATDTATSLQDKAKALKEAKDQAEASAKKWKEFGDGLQRVREGANEAALKLGKIGAAAAAAAAALATYAAGRYFKGGLEDAAEFEVALGRIQAAAGLTGDQMGRVKDAVEKAAAAASKDVTEAAAAFEMLSREGLSAEEAVSALKPALDFATASGLDTKAAIGALSGVLDQFGLAAGETSRAADVLAAASKAGGTSVGDMAKALEQVGPTARTLGVSLDDTAAALATLAKNGVEGGKAGAALRGILGELSDPTSKLRGELSELGIESSDLGEVLTKLGERGTDAESVFQALGVRGGTALRLLVQEAGGVRALSGEVGNATGAIAAMAKILNTDLATSQANVGRAFEDLRRKLMEPLLEPLRIELDEITARMREFADSPEFARIRDALVKMFKSAMEAAKGFLEAVDWDALSRQIAEFADNSGAKFGEFAEDVKDAAGTVKAAAAAIDMVVSGLVTGISTLAAAVAGIALAVGKLQIFLAEQTNAATAMAGFTEKAEQQREKLEELKIVVGGIGAVYDRFAEVAAGSAERVRNSWDTVSGGSEDAATRTEASGERIAGALDRTADNAEAAADRVATAGETIASGMDGTGTVAEQNAAVVGTASDKAATSLETLARRAAAAFAALQNAIRSGAAPDVIASLEGEFKRLNQEILKLESASKNAGGGLQSAGDSAERASVSVRSVGSELRQAGQQAEQFSGQLDSVAWSADQASYSLGAMSESAAALYGEVLRQVGTGSSWTAYLNQINGITQRVNEQRNAADERIRQLDEELARYDPMAQSLARLRHEYAMVDDARLQQIAQREERLRREQERIARETERVQQQVARVEQREQAVNSNPQRIDLRVELVVRNEQRTGSLLAELPERDLDMLARRIMQMIQQYQRVSG